MRESPIRVTDKLQSELTETERETVEEWFAEFHTWMRSVGANPDKYEGLAPGTAANYVDRLDKLLRRNISVHDPADPTSITHDQADHLLDLFAQDTLTKQNGEAYSEDGKRKKSNALQKYFEWVAATTEAAEPWSPPIAFGQNDYDSPDKLSFAERHHLRTAAMEYGSLPDYESTAVDKRERIERQLAQRLGKPKDDLTEEDWHRADVSNKIGSLVYVGLDTGLTPQEVEAATVEWVDLERNLLIIPEEVAHKERDTTEIPFDDDTAVVLRNWLEEREQDERYASTQKIWLNEAGNPYNSHNLCDLVRRLCAEIGIDTERRDIVWYSVRHNVGQCIEEIGGLDEAGDQLRHKSLETTHDTYGGTAAASRAQTLSKVNHIAKKAATDPTFDPYEDSPDDDEPGAEHTGDSNRPSYPDEVDRSTQPSGNTVHIDKNIEDTPTARNELATDVLTGDADSET